MAAGIAAGILPGMVTSTTEKVRENRLRRMAERQGFALHKKRRHDTRALDYGEVWLRVVAPISERSDDAWIGPFRDEGGRSALDQVEEWLTADDEDRWSDERYVRGRQLRATCTPARRS
jgi:hypothetical protein